MESTPVKLETLDQLRSIMESQWLWGAYLALALLVPAAYALWFRWSSSKGPERRLPERLRDMAMLFRGRAFRLRLWSGVFLYASILVLFSGLYFVIFVANELVKNDSLYLAELNNRREVASEKRASLERDAQALREKLASALAQGGGKTWFSPPHDLSNSRINRVRFLDANAVWLVGDRKSDQGVWKPLLGLAKIGDEGVTWSEATLPEDLEKGTLFDVHFSAALDSEPRKGWAVGQERRGLSDGQLLILFTSDGGKTWNRQMLPDSIAEGQLNTIKFLGDHSGWAVGKMPTGVPTEVRPLILYTDNGGKSWTTQELPNDLEVGSLEDINVLSHTSGWAVGWERVKDQAPHRSLVLSVSDDGKTMSDDGKTAWVRQTPPKMSKANRLHGVSFIDAENGSAVGKEYRNTQHRPLLVATTNGGATWKRSEYKATDEKDLAEGELLDVLFIKNKQKGWAVGESQTNKPLILTTDDGGTNWRSQLPSIHKFSGRLKGVSFHEDGEIGWAVGHGNDNDNDQPVIFATRSYAYDVANKSPTELSAFLESEAPPHIKETFRVQADALRTDIKTTDTRIEELDEFTDKITSPEPDAIQYGPLLTRVTALVLLFLLVNLLVRLYQYNTRLAGFYDARADALVLSEGHESAIKDMSLNDLIKGLSPDGHDYAVMPKSPMEQVTEVAKTVAARPG